MHLKHQIYFCLLDRQSHRCRVKSNHVNCFNSEGTSIWQWYGAIAFLIYSLRKKIHREPIWRQKTLTEVHFVTVLGMILYIINWDVCSRLFLSEYMWLFGLLFFFGGGLTLWIRLYSIYYFLCSALRLKKRNRIVNY